MRVFQKIIVTWYQIKMRQYLDILEKVLGNVEIKDDVFKMRFTTSADVVMKASGLRLEAIRVIAREQGVEIEDTACRCIGESLLAAFADAHIRKIRAYFNNARRHISDLAGDELATFIDFCKTFNKRHSTDITVLSWKDIDADAIREQFIERVHQLTPSSNILDLFAGCGSLHLQESTHSSLSFNSSGNLGSIEYQHRNDVIDRILHSHLFYERPTNSHNICLDIRSVVRRVTLSARYHIFTSEDENHQQDAINKIIINRALVMAA